MLKSLGWNEKLEEVVKDIGLNSQAYKKMHIVEAQNTNFIYTILMFCGIVTGPLGGIVSAIGSALEMSADSRVTIAEIILGFLSGIVVAILKFGKYDEVSNANKSAAAKYASLEANVRRQLCLYRKDRIEAKSYMEWLETKYAEIYSAAPLLPNNVFDSYSRQAEQFGLKIPEEYSETIEIDEIQEENQVNELSNSDVIINVSESSKKTKIQRTNTMSKIPEINHCSDQMLNYEMKRMLRE